MESRFIVPASTFIAGFVVWVAYLVWRIRSGTTKVPSPWLDAGLCVVVAGLVVFSGVSCRLAGGPRMGNFVRSGVMIVATAVTWWRAGPVPASPLALAAIVTGILALTTPE